jgi:hypothetical protein
MVAEPDYHGLCIEEVTAKETNSVSTHDVQATPEWTD